MSVQRASTSAVLGLAILCAALFSGASYALQMPSNVVAVIAQDSRKINVTWRDNATDERAYRIERRLAAAAAWRFVATLGANSTGYTDASVTKSEYYVYRVRAETTSATSTAYVESNDVRLPFAPSSLSIGPNANGQPIVQWRDNSSIESGYVIERSSDQAGSLWQAIGRTGSGVQAFIDIDEATRVDPAFDHEFQYRVRAFYTEASSSGAESRSRPVVSWARNCPTVVPNPWQAWMAALDAQLSGTGKQVRPLWGKAEPPKTAQANIGTFRHALGLVVLLYNDKYAAMFLNGALIDVTHRLYGKGFFGKPYAGTEDVRFTSPTIWKLGVASPDTTPDAADRDGILNYWPNTTAANANGVPSHRFDTTTGTLTFLWSGRTGTGITGTSTVANNWQLHAKGSKGLHGRMEVDGAPPADNAIIYAKFPFMNHLAMDRTDLVVPSGDMGQIRRNFPPLPRYPFDRVNGQLLTTSWLAQFFGVIEGDAALYVAAEDPRHHPKSLYFQNAVAITDTAGSFFTLYPEAITAPDNQRFSMDYDVVMMPHCVVPGDNDWLRIAKRYRDFATGDHTWLRKVSADANAAKLIDRDDIPKDMRDGLFWWTEWMGKYNQYGDSIVRERKGRDTLVQGSAFSVDGSIALVKEVTTGSAYHSLYREVAPVRLPNGCYAEDMTTVRYYVYESNVVGGFDWGPGDESQKRYLDDPRFQFELQGGRALALLHHPASITSAAGFKKQLTDRANEIRQGETFPIGFHTYTWHEPGFDKGNPDFKMIPGFDTIVGDANASCAGGDCRYIVPYLNASIIDMTDRAWSLASREGNPLYGKYCLYGNEMTVDRNHTPIATWKSSGQSMGRLSIGSPWWREQLTRIADNIINDIGSPGIYLDTLGGHYIPSFRTDNGDHPIGYGVWYPDRYKAVVKSIKEVKKATDAVAKPRVVAAEHGSDAFYADIDMVMFYTMLDRDKQPTTIDIMPAVYSEYKLYAGSRSALGDSALAHATKSAQHFISGRQIGLNSTYELDGVASDRAEKIAYSRTLARARLDLKSFLSYGEYLGSADPAIDNLSTTQVITKWCRNGQSSDDCSRMEVDVRLPAIRASRWQYTDRTTSTTKRVIVLTNASSGPAYGEIPVPGNWRRSDNAPLSLCDPITDSCAAIATLAGEGDYAVPVNMPARSVRVLQF